MNLEKLNLLRLSFKLPEKENKYFPYWRRHNLIRNTKGTWLTSLNVTDSIWIQILSHLQKLSYKVKDTKKLADYIYANEETLQISIDELNLEYDNLYNKNRDEDENKKFDILSKSIIEYRLNHFSVPLCYVCKINNLTKILLWCLEKNENAYLLINNKEVKEIKGELPKNIQPCIVINIKWLLEQNLVL